MTALDLGKHMLKINLNFFISNSISFKILKMKFQNGILIIQAPLQARKISY